MDDVAPRDEIAAIGRHRPQQVHLHIKRHAARSRRHRRLDCRLQSGVGEQRNDPTLHVPHRPAQPAGARERKHAHTVTHFVQRQPEQLVQGRWRKLAAKLRFEHLSTTRDLPDPAIQDLALYRSQVRVQLARTGLRWRRSWRGRSWQVW